LGFNNNPNEDWGTTINEPEAWDAYTLLSCMNGCAHPQQPDDKVYMALLVDNAGNFIHGWEDILPYFVKVMPIDYKKALNRIQEKFSKESDSVGMTEEVY